MKVQINIIIKYWVYFCCKHIRLFDRVNSSDVVQHIFGSAFTSMCNLFFSYQFSTS